MKVTGEPEEFKKIRRNSKKIWKKLTAGWFGYVIYAALGILIAFLMNQALAFGLSTDLPVVAVVSNSMEHDSTTEVNHYQWLEKNMGYNRSYIDSWPLKDGFNIGDLPIIQGKHNNHTQYKVGDVIVYSIPGQNVPIIHRIIKINPDGTYMTKGDHNSQQLPFEYSVKPEQIHGKVMFVIPKIGYFKVLVTRFLGGY
ncbi:MAG: signal peptidase I [Candidatus Heimdallarchaeota archaeon]